MGVWEYGSKINTLIPLYPYTLILLYSYTNIVSPDILQLPQAG